MSLLNFEERNEFFLSPATEDTCVFTHFSNFSYSGLNLRLIKCVFANFCEPLINTSPLLF